MFSGASLPQNGCICCTLREDLLQQVAALAEEKLFDYIIIESTGVSEPLPVAETFTFELSGDSSAGTALPAKSLNEVARLDTLVTVIDAASFLRDLDTLDNLADRGWQDKGGPAAPADASGTDATVSTSMASAEPSSYSSSTTNGDTSSQTPGDDAAAAEGGDGGDGEEDDLDDVQGISTLLVDQVEFANVIVINKCDLVPAAELSRVKAVVRGLNPSAVVLEAVRGNVPVDQVVDTNLFSMEEAANAAGWLKEARGEHTPETEEYGVSSFVFRARRPFHPARLEMLLNSDAFSSGRQYGIGSFSGKSAVDAAAAAVDSSPTSKSAATDAAVDACPTGAEAGKDTSKHDESVDQAVEQLRGAMTGKFGFIIRSKGIVWLAGAEACANDFAGEWSHAGRRVEIIPTARWMAATLQPGGSLPDDVDPELWCDDDSIGDRRVEIVVIGLSMDKASMRAAFEACLLTDAEWGLGPAGWSGIRDPIWGDMDWPALRAAMDAEEAEPEAGADGVCAVHE